MRRRVAFALALVFLFLFSSRWATAQGAQEHVLLVSEADAPLADRIRVELAALGYEVSQRSAFAPLEPLDLRFAAVVRVTSQPLRAEIWTNDRGQVVFRASALSDRDTPGVETLAIRVAEDLRAYVAPTSARGPAERGAPAKPEEAPESRAHARVRGWIGVEDALLLQPGGASSSHEAWVRGRFMAFPRLGIGAALGVPIVPATIVRAEGRATLRAFALAADAYLRLTPDHAVIDAGLGGGVAGIWLQMSGDAQAPYLNAEAHVMTLLAFTSAEVSIPLVGPLRLRAASSVGLTLPGAEVLFAGRTAAPWGRPLYMLSAGLLVAL